MACPNIGQCLRLSKFCGDAARPFWKSLDGESPHKFDSCERLDLRKSGGVPGPSTLPNGKDLPHGPAVSRAGCTGPPVR